MKRTRGPERFKPGAARRALVEAGIEILIERGVAPGLDRVTLKEAIERSGVPRTTAYRVFADDDGALASFHRSVLAALDVSASVDSSFAIVAEILNGKQDVLGSGDPAALADLCRELIRAGFNDRVEVLMAQPEWRAYVSSIAGFDGEVAAASAEVTGERFVAMFEMLGPVFGIRPIPPLTWAGFVAILVSALDGAALRNVADPSFAEFVRPSDGENSALRWNGMSILAEGLLLVWCEADPTAAVSADLSRWTAFG